MTNKELFKEIADCYLSKCSFCKSLTIYEVETFSPTGVFEMVPSCPYHLKEAANLLVVKVTNVSQVKIDPIIFGDLYKTILFFDQIDDVSKNALNDLLQFVPLCDNCEISSAIYRAHIPEMLNTNCNLCKSCGIDWAKNKIQYKIEDLDFQEAILQLEELVCAS